MKLNGALKPRQGASKQGSSPGVVQRKYRIKRYNKVNENVVKGLPLNNCGVNNKNFTVILNNSNNIYIKKQQKQQPLHREQISPQIQKQEQKHQQQEKECGENISSYSDIKNSSNISISLCSNNFSSCTKNKKQNKSTTIAKNRFSSIAEKPSECTHLSSYINNNKLQSITTVETEIVAKYYKTKINNEIDLKQRTAKVNNITTRQVKNTKINKENSNNEYYNNSSSSNHDNKNKNNSDTKKNETKTKQVKVVKTKLTSSKYHVIVNRNHNRNNSSGGGCGGYNHYRVVNNKFLLLIQKIYENLNLTFIISRLFIQLKLLLFLMFSHAIKHLTGNPFTHCSHNIGGGGGASDGDYCMANALGCQSFSLVGYKLAKIMRASITLGSSFERNISKNMKKTLTFPPIALCLLVYGAAFILLPQPVIGDDGDNFFPINGIETTTPEFDYASRGQKKFGDKCENTLECGFPGSICDTKKKSCQCTEDLPVTNHIDKCGKEAAVNESCFFNEQCEMKYFQTECRDQKCVCRFDMTPVWLKDGSVECKGRGDKKGPETYIDPAMIGVLIGMALMFIIICVVLRLFSQARWRENRTIFNTPNPRLMNVSLLRESKLLHGQERRGSRMSVRAPSRQPSMASLRPHSPNPSLGRMTRSKSNTRSSDSRVSDASNCSRLLEHHTASTHHASHIHANTTAPHASTTNHGPQASVSPISINAPTTTITYANQSPVAGNTTCSSNLTTPPPTITNKPNKF